MTALCFSADGRLLATGSSDHTVKLFDTATGAIIRTLEGHSQGVAKVAFSPTGMLASGASCDSIKVWDLETARALWTVPALNLVTGLAFAPDGKHLLVAQSVDAVRVLELETGRCVASALPLPEGWAVFDSDGRCRYSGNVAGYFWHAIGLCRFEPGELDEFLPELKLPVGPLF